MEAGVCVRLARVGRFVTFAFARRHHHSLVVHGPLSPRVSTRFSTVSTVASGFSINTLIFQHRFTSAMTENAPPDPTQQPRRRRKPAKPTVAPSVSTAVNASATGSPATTGPKTPLRKVGDGGQESGSAPSTKKRKQFRSGYEVSPQALSYVPYALEMKGRKRTTPFGLPDGSHKKQPRIAKKLSPEDLNRLARDANILPPSAELRDFQVQCTLRVLQRGGDICVLHLPEQENLCYGAYPCSRRQLLFRWSSLHIQV